MAPSLHTGALRSDPEPSKDGFHLAIAGNPCQTVSLNCICTLAMTVFLLLSVTARSGEIVASSLVPANEPATPILDASYGLGSWIWSSETRDKQTCRFWKSFEIPANLPITKAHVLVTVDNGYELRLDGWEVGRGSDWRSLTDYDITPLIRPGPHVLAVEAFNDQDKAGLILGMRIEFADGQVMAVVSDRSWRVVPLSERSSWARKTQPAELWPAATLVGALGAAPWWSSPLRTSRIPAPQPLVLGLLQHTWIQVLLLSVSGAVTLLCLWLMTQLVLQSRAEQLIRVERARIARDIHDELGAGLTQLGLLGEVARSELPQDSPPRLRIEKLCERSRELSRTMDEIVWAVNSRKDTLKDFGSYMCKFAQAFLESSPIRCRLDIEPSLPAQPFDLPIRRNLFLAAKEALHNVAKHSRAAEVFLRIHRQSDGLIVVVEDDGCGFELAQTDPERNGVANMVQRMHEVGGSCQIRSQPGKGCRVEFMVPRLQSRRRFFDLAGKIFRAGSAPKASRGTEAGIGRAPISHLSPP